MRGFAIAGGIARIAIVISVKANMGTITPAAASKARPMSVENADDAIEEGFKPLSAEEAQRWRKMQPSVSPWPVVGVQAGVGVAAAAAAWLLSGGEALVVGSTVYGVLAAWLPAVLFARMVARKMRIKAHAGSALMALMVWEGIKIVLTLALLLAAPKILAQVHWLALLAGFVVTIKAAWVALWLMSAKRRPAASMD